jgi:hypothetical protein
VIFEDEEGNNINRKDLTKDEVSNLLKTTEDDIKIWRTFEIDRKPHKWVVWPHSETRGWINKIEGRL